MIIALSDKVTGSGAMAMAIRLELFKPGLMLRAYLTYDLGDWPCYAFGDLTFISERSLHPRLLLIDTGLAARPFTSAPQWEFRLGAENTADSDGHGGR